jgi:hypothetical protein
MTFPIIIPEKALVRDRLLTEIQLAIDIIDRLDDFVYRKRTKSSASVGKQFRHNLDFLNLFLHGIDVGRIDYTRRERDISVERYRNYAIEQFETAAARIANLKRSRFFDSIAVRSEIEAGLWLQSSVIREMEFVLSHTVHHHALIALKLAGSGIELEQAVGVAPSTEEYWNKIDA